MILNGEVLANSILKRVIRYCTIMIKAKENQYLYVFCFARWLLKMQQWPPRGAECKYEDSLYISVQSEIEYQEIGIFHDVF